MENKDTFYSITPPPGLMQPEAGEEYMPPVPAQHEASKEHLPLAMAYVPRQSWKNIYDNGKGIMRGTIFEELDLPFKGASR